MQRPCWVRPARPARCFADAWLTRSVSRLGKPDHAAWRATRARPESITSVTVGIVIEVSATLVETTTLRRGPGATAAINRIIDILGLRFVEIWSSIPFLYTVIILASIFQPSFMLLVPILAAFSWISITYYIRGEFYREKAKDYLRTNPEVMMEISDKVLIMSGLKDDPNAAVESESVTTLTATS